MAPKSIFVTCAINGRAYPSLLSRIVFAGIYSFAALNFYYVSTGESIFNINYWSAKIIVWVCAILVLEYIYRIHLWCASRFGKGGNFLRVGIHQFLLGVVFPRLLIWLILTKWLGVSYLSYIEFIGDESGKSTAMVFEFLMIANISFFICYTYMLQILAAHGRNNTKNILVFHLGSVDKIDIGEVLCIIHTNGANVLVTEFASGRKLVSKAPLDEVYLTLPTDIFELRERGIFKIGIAADIEEMLWQYADKFYPGIYPM